MLCLFSSGVVFLNELIKPCKPIAIRNIPPAELAMLLLIKDIHIFPNVMDKYVPMNDKEAMIRLPIVVIFRFFIPMAIPTTRLSILEQRAMSIMDK